MKHTLSLPVASPCIQLCQINVDSGWCIGCYRTLEEIANWGINTPSEQYALLKALTVRRAQQHNSENLNDVCF